jgi:putative transposase
MGFNPDIHHRQSIRLKDYDYSAAGAYFITVCTQNRACLFGEIMDGTQRLNDAGRMVQAVWDEMPLFYPGVQTDAFVVMPNHIHGIIILAPTTTTPAVGATPRGCPDFNVVPGSDVASKTGQAQGPAPTGAVDFNVVPGVGRPQDSGQPRGVARTGMSLADVVHRFKTMTTHRYTDGVKNCAWPSFAGRLWQRNYWERVIRDEAELHATREYIHNNPVRWELDKLYVGAGV